MLLPSHVQNAQPQFPQTNAQVNYPQGIQLTVTLAPGIAFTVIVGHDSVEQWLALWESQKTNIAQHLQNGKNG